MVAREEDFKKDYSRYGFVTDIDADQIPAGLSEDTVRLISAKKSEPEWMLEWRLQAFRYWQKMKEPTWAAVQYPRSIIKVLFTTPRPNKKRRPRICLKSIQSF